MNNYVKNFVFCALLIIFASICYRIVAPKWVVQRTGMCKYNRFTGELYVPKDGNDGNVVWARIM